jgi:hypothetical protein
MSNTAKKSDETTSTGTISDADLKEIRKNARSSFWKVSQQSAWQVIEKAPSIWSGPEDRFYRTEKKIITKHVEPIYWGSFVSLFLFTTFRLSGSRLYSRFRESFVKKQPVTTTTTSSTKHTSTYAQTKKPEQWKSYLDQQAERTREAQKDLLELPTDIIISITCGCSAILLFSQPKQIKKDFIEMPLQPGKSVVTDIFCPNIEAVYRKHVDPRILTKDSIETDDSMNLFLSFIKNCHTRSEYIQYQKQLGTIKRPDVIPYPGLDGVRR